MELFNAGSNMMAIGKPAFRILSTAWLISIPSLVFAAALQGLSLGTHSMILTMARQAVLPVLFALLLRLTGSLNMIWLGYILAEAICIPLALYLWRKAYANVPES